MLINSVATESVQKAERVDNKRQRLRDEKKCFNLKNIGVDLSESNITEEQRERRQRQKACLRNGRTYFQEVQLT